VLKPPFTATEKGGAAGFDADTIVRSGSEPALPPSGHRVGRQAEDIISDCSARQAPSRRPHHILTAHRQAPCCPDSENHVVWHVGARSSSGSTAAALKQLAMMMSSHRPCRSAKRRRRSLLISSRDARGALPAGARATLAAATPRGGRGSCRPHATRCCGRCAAPSASREVASTSVIRTSFQPFRRGRGRRLVAEAVVRSGDEREVLQRAPDQVIEAVIAVRGGTCRTVVRIATSMRPSWLRFAEVIPYGALLLKSDTLRLRTHRRWPGCCTGSEARPGLFSVVSSRRPSSRRRSRRLFSTSARTRS